MPQRLPQRWSLKHNPLSGLTFAQCWQLLRDNHFVIDFAYAHRAAFLTLISGFNSVCAAIERRRYGPVVSNLPIRDDPIFILGHWRSGTTHLHNLLALDDRLVAPTTFQVVNPSSFLSTQRVLPRVFKPLLPHHRPMDNMVMSFDAPQEDELALSLLSQRSLYLALSFPRRSEHYNRYLTFSDVPEHEIELWKQAFLAFVRKLSLGNDRCLVLKSPAHTARIGLLLQMFPRARFVHLHRDPYVVFQSSRHYFQTAAWYANLQKFDPSIFESQIIRRYAVLYDAYLQQRDLIPPGRLHELSYDSLTSDPLGELRRLYTSLGLASFTDIQVRVEQYLDSVAKYQTNRYGTLGNDERHRVASAWGRYFQAFGYPTEIAAVRLAAAAQGTPV